MNSSVYSGTISTTSSMTAFGAARHSSPTGEYYCEIRCVNHRFLDINLRLPEELRAHEANFRELISSSLSRGRIDFSLKREETSDDGIDIEINNAALETLFQSAATVAAKNPEITPLTMSEVLRWPGVMQSPEIDAEQVKQDALISMQKGLSAAQEARLSEGGKLQSLIEKRIAEMREIVAAVQTRMPELQDQYRARLEAKLTSVKENMEENRLEQEMVLFLNKTDVMEELDRLNVHFDEVESTLKQNQAKGRRLDFLMQELNREANTLGSKSQDAQLTQQSVELKVLIEQMREQVQNIE